MSEPVPAERLWQRLKHAGFGTRARITELIASGAVRLDGRVASPVARLSRDSVVTVHGEVVQAPVRMQYWLLNKPLGIDCCIRPERSDSIAHILAKLPPGLFPVGRLDKDSSGALLLTNDGMLCHRLMHPDHWHEKEYVVRVDSHLTAAQIDRLRSGASYELGPRHYHPRPCEVEQVSSTELRITLTEGRHRQVRHMCRAAGLKVIELHRVRLNRLPLGDLEPGAVRELGQEEVELLQRESWKAQGDTEGGLGCVASS